MAASAQANPGEQAFDWLYFAGRSGRSGRAWAEAYGRHRGYEQLGQTCLHLLRRRRLAEGRAALETLKVRLHSLEGEPASIRHVLARWYHGLEGYYFYTTDDLSKAERAMARAHEAVAAAISRRRFLILLANHCHEFTLHRARVARNRRAWRRMARLVAQARGMMDGSRPFCRLADGSTVCVATLKRFYRRGGPLTEAESAAVNDWLDDGRRLAAFDHFVRQLHVLPGFVIPYP